MIQVGLLLAGILSVALGALSLPQWRRIPEIRFFVLTTLGTAAWSLGIAVFLATNSTEMLTMSIATYYIAGALIALSALLVGYTALKGRRPPFPVTLIVSIPFFFWVVCLIVAPNAFFTGVLTVGGQNTVELNIYLYMWYLVYFFVYYLTALVFMFLAYVKTKTRARIRLGYLFWAYAASSIVGMVFNLIFPLFGHYDLVWVGPLGVLVFVPIIYVAITRYGLFDVRETLSRTLTYVLTLAILAALYAVLSASITSWFFREGTNSPTTYTINVIIVLCLVLVFQPIRRFFDRATNNLFYRHQYHRDDFYRQINTILGETTELRKLLSRLSVTIGSTLSSKQVFMTVYRNHEPVTVGTPNHQRVSQKDLEWLDSVARKTSLLLLDRNKIWFSESTAPDRFMVSYGLTIVLPLRHVDRIVGYVFLGEHKNQGYTRRDYEVLETITDELALAVQNALAVEEIRDLNDTLQQRIEAATSELRRSNAQLRKLDEAKDEFISMASHQLRTPLTSIKGYIDMILDGDAGAITPTQKQFLTEAFVSSERMVHLINDFLNVSRLQTGKFVIELQPTDLALLVSQELDSLRINAASRPLSFEYKPPKNLPLLMLDEAKIRQVIMNFADNSLYYSKPGTVIKVRLSLKDDAVTFTVKDTGIGVPLDDQPKLFTKFFRAANARKQRPDGTGVGLYLAKRVITEHHGVIEFASVEGKGSTFGFTLPLSKLRVHDKTNKLVDKPADN